MTIRTVLKNVDIYVDGRLVGAYDGQPIQVAPGPHALRFANPCCADETVLLRADQTVSELARPKWKSARVAVVTSPPSADISYTTSQRTEPGLARGGEDLLIKVPPESQSGQVGVHLRVTAPGYHAAELDLVARAGQRIERRVELARLP